MLPPKTEVSNTKVSIEINVGCWVFRFLAKRIRGPKPKASSFAPIWDGLLRLFAGSLVFVRAYFQL